MPKKRDDESMLERKLLLVFAENAQAFTASEAEEMRAQLRQLLESKRQSLLATPALLDQYVVELIHRCPNFLDVPVGFEWVSRDHKALLQRSRIMPDLLKRYWNTTIPEVRKLFIPKGSPQTHEHQLRDIEQAMAVHIAMNKGLSVTHAVEAVIAAREKMGLVRKEARAPGTPADRFMRPIVASSMELRIMSWRKGRKQPASCVTMMLWRKSRQAANLHLVNSGGPTWEPARTLKNYQTRQ